MVDFDDQVGRQFGEYRTLQKVGQGGWANVYVAEHTTTNTKVAIKVLHTELSGEELEKFNTQARMLANLRHPHIVHVHEFGIENNFPFLIMDYAPYGTLRQIHPRGARLPLSTIVSYVKQIADALQYIHDQNLIHRDIKPHNLLLGPEHEILLSDFGIALLSQNMSYRRQQVQEFEGTVLYAAPEQLRGLPRIASDQYALAVVVYEWLCGDWPFHGTVEEIASQHTLVPPPLLHEKVPTISPAVEYVILRALAKEPLERFESVQEFATALERASRLGQADPGLRQPTPIPPSPIPLSPIPLLTKRDPSTDAPSTAALTTYHEHTEKIHMLAWSPSGKLIASTSVDETIQIWNPMTGANVLTQRTNSLQAPSITWSPDGKFIAFTSGLASDTVQIYDASSGRISTSHATYTEHEESIHALAWSPDGKYIASAGEDNMVQVWDVTTGLTVYTYQGHSLCVTNVAWSPDSTRIASCSEDKTVQVWEATRGGDIFVYYAHLDKVNAVTWSPGGTHVASASEDGTVHVWDSSSGRKALTYPGHSGGITDVAWSCDGLRLASSSLDETVQIWHVMTGSALFTYTGHTDWVSSVAWSPDGQYLASGSWDKTIQVWQVT